MAAAIFQPCHLPSTFISILFFLSFTSPLFSLISSSSSDFVFHRQFLQSNSPQNIETFFPSGAAPPLFPPNPPALSPSSTNKPSETPPSSSPTKIQETSWPPEKTTGRTVAKAVVATAASTIVFAGIFFFFLQRCVLARRRQPEKIQKANMSTRPDETPVSYSAFNVLDGTLKELVVDENGLDVLYWRKLHSRGQGKNGFQKEVLGQPDEGRRVHGKADLHLKSDPNVKIQSSSTMSSSSTVGVLPELRGTSPFSPPPGLCSKNSASSSQNLPESRDPYRVFSHPSAQSSNQSSQIQSIPKDPDRFFSPPKSNSLESSSQIQPGIGGTNSISAATDTDTPIAAVAMARPTTQIPVPLPQHPKFAPPPPPQPTRAPPPPPQPPRAQPPPPPPQPPRAPPPPPTAAVKKAPAPPPLPPIKNLVPPPPPPRASGTKPPPSPPASKGKSSSIMTSEPSSTDSSKERNAAKAKMRPLHWDKFVANADHSMVWDKIGSGSFRFDGDLMEALFGYASTNKKSTDENKNLENTSKANSNETLKSCLLDPRKSQNIAIVLKSLYLSRQEILDALLNGNGLNADTLEKLTKIAPTKEEETMILEFSGDPSKLADAESFLYHLVRNAPSPFLRLDAMFFKSNYDSEILHLKESLQTLESACKELRTRGLFLKLLEAVLKAGNRMNAGTARGNAQAFNLAALCKLSDVKSTDGKTTLLHFVVEEVVRLEGKRCVINRNHSLGRSNSKLGSNTMGKEERDREYIMLGLPLVGGLSVEFSNVKKAATIDYGGFVNACKTLTARINGIRQFLGGQNVGRGDTFVREMKGFLKAAEEELKVVKEEETRVMELVKRTTGYYQSGASKDRGAHQLQLFIIVKDFLCMVDQACIDIARSQQQKKKLGAGFGGSSPPQRPAQRVPLRFPNLPTHFLSDNSKTSSDS